MLINNYPPSPRNTPPAGNRHTNHISHCFSLPLVLDLSKLLLAETLSLMAKNEKKPIFLDSLNMAQTMGTCFLDCPHSDNCDADSPDCLMRGRINVKSDAISDRTPDSPKSRRRRPIVFTRED